jgi:CcmD family protein
MIYLFVAFGSVWLAFFGYSVYLVRRMDRLERETELLKGFLEEHNERSE